MRKRIHPTHFHHCAIIVFDDYGAQNLVIARVDQSGTWRITLTVPVIAGIKAAYIEIRKRQDETIIEWPYQIFCGGIPE